MRLPQAKKTWAEIHASYMVFKRDLHTVELQLARLWYDLYKCSSESDTEWTKSAIAKKELELAEMCMAIHLAFSQRCAKRSTILPCILADICNAIRRKVNRLAYIH